MSKNYYDGYIRKNPRSNAKCNPILYRDNYKPYFKSNLNYNLQNENLCEVEHFTNMNDHKNIQLVNNNMVNKKSEPTNIKVAKNSADLDNYSYIKSIDCDGNKATINTHTQKKMYDISPRALMKQEVLGNVEEIDAIHNDKIKREMNYGDMKLSHLRNTMQKLHYNLNPMLVHAHERNYLGEPFFQDK